MPEDASSNRGNRRRPTRLLVVTNIYPTPDRPNMSPFVARRVAALRARGVEVVLAGPASYAGNTITRHLGIGRRALTARGPFDGVEAHPVYAAGVIGLLAARLRRIPLVAYAHGGDVADYATRNRFHRALAGWVVRGASAVVANSQDTAGFVERLGRTPRVISPGFDPTVFSPVKESEARGERAGLGLPEGLVALYVGTLSERKGADVFVAGLALAAGSGWSGVLVGDGPLSAKLASAGAPVLLRPAASHDRVAAMMRAVDVVVVPSRREPLGLAAVEALACGTPVIASAVGGLREVIRDGENGLLIPSADPAALALALRRLGDGRLRRRLGRAGPASVARHDIEVAAQEMAEVWAAFSVSA
jgi:D-inositol-3-phosphate glycosyltransferase